MPADYNPHGPAVYVEQVVDIPAGTGYAVPQGHALCAVFTVDADAADLRFRIGGAGRYVQNDAGVNWVGVVNACRVLPIKVVSDGVAVFIWNLGVNAVTAVTMSLERY